MARAIDVAKFLLYLGAKDDKVNDLSNLKLQKLVYYSQGASIYNNKKLLFSDPIEAWQFGPVVKEVYKEYNSYGSLPIDFKELSDETDLISKNFNLTPEEINAVLTAWTHFSRMDPWKLVESTHAEPPWKNAWRRGEEKISQEDLESFFQ